MAASSSKPKVVVLSLNKIKTSFEEDLKETGKIDVVRFEVQKVKVGTTTGDKDLPEVRQGKSFYTYGRISFDQKKFENVFANMFPAPFHGDSLKEDYKRYTTFNDSRPFNGLLYEEGDHFARHTDSKFSRDRVKLMTVLYFNRHEGLEGGDLVMKVSPDDVHDPEQFLKQIGD